MDDNFKRLYKQFWDELQAAPLNFTNNTLGYRKWYKMRLYQLCIEYRDSSNVESTEKSDHTTKATICLDCIGARVVGTERWGWEFSPGCGRKL